MFLAYAALGVLGGLVYARIPVPARAPDAPATAALGPSRGIVYKLAALFSIDAFAGGFVVQSLLALWLFERFDLSLSAASVFFFWTGVLFGVLVPGRGLDRGAHRTGEHDGVHAHPLQPVPDRGGVRAIGRMGAGPAAGARRAVADGRADPLVLRDGSGHRGRTAGCRERDRRAAQPRLCRQSGACGRALRRRIRGVAAAALRRAEDPLRPAAVGGLPAHQAARGETVA